ncbi:hypothetical protein AB6A40_003697 [Gnathostoma spinigerum]|uniref:Ras-associating domain-containing protein n=1 Tax=Gnathostoma spinigerum TaxID=75299 RepID=A0ABD6EAB1_9BILA
MRATDAEREQLHRLVDQWNENRLDLFSLSYPTEDLEINGVMRFYFQEPEGKVSTKCIRVSSTATTRAVIEALVDKFHPDLKMLTNPEYSLWEVHENGDERCLNPEEKPLLVQLNWHKDDREGRFLLRRRSFNNSTNQDMKENEMNRNQKRYSKREKKELRKKHKQAALSITNTNKISDQLYKEVPSNNFTRTISNPEIVMKKRRERKLESKLREIGQGGSLKVYGYELVPSRPYVTILVSTRDTAGKIVKDTLEKYGLEAENPNDYVLVEITLVSSEGTLSRSLSDLHVGGAQDRERYLDDGELPLAALINRPSSTFSDVIFAVRKRPANLRRCPRTRHTSLTSLTHVTASDYADPKRLESPYALPPSSTYKTNIALSPFLVALSADGRAMSGIEPIAIKPSVTDIGSDPSMGLFLPGEHVRPRHCVINFMNGVVTITPSVSDADIELNGIRIFQTAILRNGNLLRIGRAHIFRYFESPAAAMTTYQPHPQNHSRPPIYGFVFLLTSYSLLNLIFAQFFLLYFSSFSNESSFISPIPASIHHFRFIFLSVFPKFRCVMLLC